MFLEIKVGVTELERPRSLNPRGAVTMFILLLSTALDA